MITKSYCWRKTAVALAAFTLLGFSTSNALALSLGSMTVRSALGEPLRAEIDITSITAEEINSFSIRVAPPDAFVAAGLEYNGVLKNTLATLQRRPNGGHYIRLSSNSPINEPYLDLILEASSSSGRVARDYPMLFDPPVRSQAATAAATAPVPVLAQVPPFPAEPDMEPYPSYPSYSSYPSAPQTQMAQTAPMGGSAQPASAYRIPLTDDSPRPFARPTQVAGDDLGSRTISEASPAAGPSAVGSSASVGDAMAEEFPDFSQIPVNPHNSEGRTTPQPTKRTPSAVVKRPQSRAIARLRHSTRAAAAPTAHDTSGLTVGANPASVVVKRGDTAAKIAESVKPANVSLDDMLAALVRANPDAFINNDPNRVRVGAVLKVPGTEAGANNGATGSGTDPAQSLTAESQNFDKYRRDLATQAPRTPTEGASRKAMGRIQTQVEEKNAIAAAPDKLTLSKGAIQGKSPETAIANERATKETSNRAADISKNIADLQKLGASSPALPTLPASAVVPPASAARPASAVLPASTVVAAASASASIARPAASAASGVASVALPASAATVASAAFPASTASAAMSAASTPASAASSASMAGAAGKPSTVSTPSPSVEPPGLLNELMESEDLLLPVAGGIGVLLAGLGGLAFWRSRKRKEEMLAEESSFIESRIPPDSFFGASGGQHVDTSQEEDNHNSSAMIYSPSQLNAIDDVDPVAEADVYLAYGRDVQAEEILREALLTNPGRAAIHTKLLEILSKRQDAEAFEVAATQASQIVKKDSPEWTHICELGQAIDPSNALYQMGRPAMTGVGMQIFASSASSASALEMAAAHAESSEPEEKPSTIIPTQVQSQTDMDLDLDLDFSTEDNAPTVAPISMSAPLSIPALRPEPEPEPAPPAMPAPSHDLNINLDAALDMEFDLSAPMPALAPTPAPAPEPMEADMTAQSLEEMFNLNFDELPNTFALPSATAPKAATPPPAASIAANPDGNGALLEFNLDDFQLPGTTPTPAGGSAGGRLEDPLETKLALAQEFVAIGDEFGAREILEEVIASATGDLQAKARAALAKLG